MAESLDHITRDAIGFGIAHGCSLNEIAMMTLQALSEWRGEKGERVQKIVVCKRRPCDVCLIPTTQCYPCCGVGFMPLISPAAKEKEE